MPKILIAILVIFLSGCASLSVEPDYTGSIDVDQEVHVPEVATPLIPESRDGVEHTVGAGQTLWRIANTYGVAIEDIVRSNNIIDATQIEKGQKLFIPGAEYIEQVIVEDAQNEDEFTWPVDGLVISRFRDRTQTGLNKGIDIKVSVGSPVRAARTGRVVFADNLTGYGSTVILKHDDDFYSVYARNEKILVELNDLVFKNKTISHVGKTGDMAYLHFEIRRKGIEDNPLYYLPK